MLRKVILGLAMATFLLGSLNVAFVRSQDEGVTPTEEDVNDFESAREDYVFNSNAYRNAHADYLLARSQYLQAETLVAQTKARDATVTMLETRDETMKTYLVALKYRLAETGGVSDPELADLARRIDTDFNWFTDHKLRINSAGTLEDLVDDSDEAKEHFLELSERLSYETLSVIAIAKLHVLRGSVLNTFSVLKTKVDEIKQKGDHDLEGVDRWLLEIENKMNRSLDKEIEAQNIVFLIQTGGADRRKQNPQKDYSEVLSKLEESRQFIREVNEFMKEVVRRIKTQS